MTGHMGNGYRGYQIHTVWVKDHWVHKVSWRGEWVDTFLTLDEVKAQIDTWVGGNPD